MGKFGQQAGSLKNLKKSLAKGSSNSAFIKYIPKNGVMNVRFVEEPENWFNYVEHFDTALRRSYPCSGDDTCPGCASQERKTARYLANAVDLDGDPGRVVPLQMPKDLANRLVVKYEKWGSVTDRDIELSRQGEGLDTTYDLEADIPKPFNTASLKPLDLNKVLEDAYNSVFGDDDDDDSDDDGLAPATPTVKARKRSAAAGAAKASSDTPMPKNRKKAPEPEFAVDDDDDADDEDVDTPEPDTDPEPEDVDTDDTDEDDGVYDEATLKALPFGALRSVARDFGVDTKGKKAPEIIAEILDAGEEVDDDEPPF